MMTSSSKRSFAGIDYSSTSSSKRSKVTDIARLADLRGAADAFSNSEHAGRAREKGILRSRDASSKYEEVCPP